MRAHLNTGTVQRLSAEPAQKHGAHTVVGVDIDSELVALAWKRRRYLWSLQGPHSSGSGKRKRDEDEPPVDEHYFPAALQHMFGPLTVPRATADAEEISFPHNVAFIAVDWAANGCTADALGYDVILACVVSLRPCVDD